MEFIPKTMRDAEIINKESVKKRNKSKPCYSQTEMRLRAYPLLMERITESSELLSELEELGAMGLRQHSKSYVRMIKPSQRISPDEMAEYQIKQLKAQIAADKFETDKIEEALQKIEDDTYAPIIEYKYFDEMSDNEISEKMCCDPSTIRRHKVRLVKKIAIMLYGVDALYE